MIDFRHPRVVAAGMAMIGILLAAMALIISEGDGQDMIRNSGGTSASAPFFPPKTFPGYRATVGWDTVTGLGSPDAQTLIPLLARYDVR